MDGLTTRITLEAETSLPTEFGTFDVKIYRGVNGDLSTAVIFGNTKNRENLPVRVHSACFTSEVLNSLKCDCKQQLDFALKYIKQNDGIVLYLPQEGRGIGLSNKIRAYALQELGHDTIEANTLLGLPVDSRTYDEAADILRDLGVESIQLLTNNPLKLSTLQELGIKVKGRLPVPAHANRHSAGYLLTKRERMGHMLEITGDSNGNLQFNNDDEQHIGTVAEHQLPLVHINFALHENGLSTTQNGYQECISCDTDWRRVHELRERYAAVAVGANTWLNDSPQLTARSERLGRQPDRQPDRVIFAGKQRCAYTVARRRTFVIGSAPVAESEHDVIIPASDHDLSAPLKVLRQCQIESLLVEGGLTLVRSFIDQQLADIITVYVKTASPETAIQAVNQAIPALDVQLCDIQHFGKGILLSVTQPSLTRLQPAEQAAYG